VPVALHPGVFLSHVNIGAICRTGEKEEEQGTQCERDKDAEFY